MNLVERAKEIMRPKPAFKEGDATAYIILDQMSDKDLTSRVAEVLKDITTSEWPKRASINNKWFIDPSAIKKSIVGEKVTNSSDIPDNELIGISKNFDSAQSFMEASAFSEGKDSGLRGKIRNLIREHIEVEPLDLLKLYQK